MQRSGIGFIDGIQTAARSLDAQSALSGHREPEGRMEPFRGKVNSNKDLKAIQLGGKLFYEWVNIWTLTKQLGSA